MSELPAAEVPSTPESRKRALGVAAGIVALMVALLFAMGRSAFGPDGTFGIWEGDIWSPHTSQRFADPYSFSHLGHGLCFFGGLWLAARRRLAPEWRWIIAVSLEAGWEILENSPIIINRYRNATISLDYVGDSVMNSVSDVLMMSAGFLFAARFRLWPSVIALLVMEIGCAIMVRDNLTLNVIMLIHPLDAVKAWQLGGKPG